MAYEENTKDAEGPTNDDVTTIALIQKCMADSEEARENLRSNAWRARVFVAGGIHVRGAGRGGITNYDQDLEQDTPKLMLFPSKFARYDRYISSSESKPEVVSEEDNSASFQGSEVDPFDEVRGQLQQMFGVQPDGDYVAKILTARLDRMCEKMNLDSFMRDVRHTAALERIAAVRVGYDLDETNREPAYCELVLASQLVCDPDSPKPEDGRWLGYIETEATLEEVSKRYDIPLDELEMKMGDVDAIKEQEATAVPRRLQKIQLRHIWIRNLETETVETEGEDGEEAESAEIYKYKGGWQKTVSCYDKLIYSGDSDTPTGKPPIHVFAWWKHPNYPDYQSLLDWIMEYIKGGDRLQRYGLDAVERSLPKTLLNKSKIKNPEAVFDNEVMGTIVVDGVTGSMQEALMHLPGGGPGAALYETFDRLMAVGDEVCGTAGVDFDDVGKNSSGKAISNVQNDKLGLAAIIQENYLDFKKALVTDLLEHIIEYEDTEETLRIIGQDGKAHQFTYKVGLLKFEGADIEAKFDVVVSRPKNMASNPIDRAGQMNEIMATLMGMVERSPVMARTWVQVSDLPYKETWYRAIDTLEAQMQGAQQGDNPEAEKAKIELMQTEKEEEIKLKAHAAQAVSDSMEKIIQSLAQTDPAYAASLVKQIPILVMEAWQSGQPPQIPPIAPPMQAATPMPMEAEMQGQVTPMPPNMAQPPIDTPIV